MGKSIRINYLNPRSEQEKIHALRYYIARAFIESGDTVLDLGCGSGYGSLMLSKIAKKVLAFDINKSFEDKFGAPNIEFLNKDIRGLSLPEADVIVAIESIEHTEKPEDLILEIKKKARKFIIISYPKFATSKLDSSHLSDPNPKEIRVLIENKSWLQKDNKSSGIGWRWFFEHNDLHVCTLQVYKNYE